MVKHLSFLVLFLSTLTFAPQAKNDNGASWWVGEAAAKKYTKADLFRNETILKYEAWKASNPDRELRLYNRIKKINNRTVRLQNTMIIGFAVLFGCILLLFFYVVAMTKALSGNRKNSDETRDAKAG